MPRTLDPDLLAAMNAGSFTPWFKLELLDSDRSTVLFETEEVVGFELEGLTCKVQFHEATYHSDYTTFRISRGIEVAGVPNYITSSQFYPFNDRHDKLVRSLEGHVFPFAFFTTPGDVTYHEVIDAVCTEYGLGVVFADPAAAWLDYQFYPTGRTLTLNSVKQFFTIIRQKYLIFATDNGDDELLFYHAHNTAPAAGDYISFNPGKLLIPGHGSYKEKSFLSRDENKTTHTSGSADAPIHNLGFLESTASHPARTYFYDTPDWVVQEIAPNLKYLDFDGLKPTFNLITVTIWPARMREIFDKKMHPSWQWQAKFLDVFGNTEGGAIPSTIEAAAPYTPINVTDFTHNLNSAQNNLQAFADKVDELDVGPAIYISTPKHTLVDDDIFPIVDSETAGHLTKAHLWSDLKAHILGLQSETILTNTAGGTYTVPAGIRNLHVRAVGAGGGGGASQGGAGQCSCSAGGAGGSYGEKWIDVDPGDEFVWDVGAAGAGGAAGNNPGNAGGDTTFGVLSCPGGGGGPSMATGTTVIGTNGTAGPAVASNADFTIPGGDGWGGIRMSGTWGASGFGGLSPFASMARGRQNLAGAGITARGYGGGGAGTKSVGAGDYAGGDGSAGVIIVEELG